MKPNKLIYISGSFVALFVIAFLIFIFTQQKSIDPSQLEFLANQSYEQGDFESSIEQYLLLLEQDQKNVEARIGLANSYIALAQLEEAERVFLEGTELIPTEPQFYIFLSTLYANQSNIISALSTLEKGVTNTNSTQLQSEYNNYVNNIGIYADHPLIQKGVPREFGLIWIDSMDRYIPIEAEWEIVDGQIAEINESTTTHVSVQGKELGKTKILATVGTITRELEVEIKEQVIESLDFVQKEFSSLLIGETVELSVIAEDAKGEAVELPVDWVVEHGDGSLSETVGMASSYTAEKDGIHVITISYEDLSTSLEIRVGDEKNKTVLTKTIGEGSVSISPQQGSYPVGYEITIEAIPAAEWSFSHWEGDVSGTNRTLTIDIQDHVTAIAVFTKDSNAYTLRVSKTGEGEVIRSSLQASFSHNETVTLTASPKSGWTFSRWTGDIQSTNPRLQLNMNQDYQVRAVFIKNESTTDPKEDKKEESSPSENPNTKDNNKKDKSNNDKPAPPAPSQPEKRQFTLSTSVSGDGNITRNPSGQQFDEGVTVTLTAQPNSGWEFVRWSGDGSGTSRTIQVTMNGNKQVQAVFQRVQEEPKTVSLFTTVLGSGSIRQSQSGHQFPAGTTITLTATPAEGYRFVGWRGSLSNNNREIQITLQQDTIIQAYFEKEETEID
ncbi:tetratricopeptide repeat protein [Alkalihalobacillus sp. LMS39]|uniref:InlB B-repeat-containing protein n=1 Tax=Alkalihalobacillus sp. LMS39 TaxID=2924032 RepID=UPI001FB3E8C7|nr:tetratricopeptide repeat protein [Alkalihalobacillus sp. LMS39]UOE93834.1 tetratricopeptide repeat protein [Alkalihalobacillus sp. LMS39]